MKYVSVNSLLCRVMGKNKNPWFMSCGIMFSRLVTRSFRARLRLARNDLITYIYIHTIAYNSALKLMLSSCTTTHVCCMTNTRKYIIRKPNEKRFLLLRGSCGNWLHLIGLWFVRIRERLVGLLGNHLFACQNHVRVPRTTEWATR